MEMTPISPRDVSVSSGVGAEPHGRETSSSGTTEANTTTQSTTAKTNADFEKPEVPVDPRADALAARLRMADPNMDATTAKKIAKQLLTPTPQWEIKSSAGGTDPKTSQFDATA